MSTRSKIAVLILLMFSMLSPAAPVVAQQSSCSGLGNVQWREERIQNFAIIYPENFGTIISGLLVYSSILDQEYVRFNQLFGVDLGLPVTIRFYPTTEDFFCLNAVRPNLQENQSHTHFGLREISFIGDRLNTAAPDWSIRILNDFRYELASLFAGQITDQKLPPGLRVGVSLYAQDPRQVPDAIEFTGTGFATPGQSWRYIWENEASEKNPVLRMGSVTIVAYLVDAYGWSNFIQFLKKIPTSDGYRQALFGAYAVDFDALEAQWQIYYPLYFQGRWQAHAFYDFDLSSIELLIKNGAYQDAAQSLRDAIIFLEKTGQTKKLEQARNMLTATRAGEEAGDLAAQARQALQAGEYQHCIDLANQSMEKYGQLGDERRIAELDTYRSLAQEALDLRVDANNLITQVGQSGDNAVLSTRLMQVLQKMAELGDQTGQEIVRQTLANIEARKKNLVILSNLIASAICVLLVGLRFILLIRKRPPEAL